MLVRAIKKDKNEFSEWLFGHSMLDYRDKQDQIAQDIYTALNEWKYDCFFALENGIDWYTRLGKPNQRNLLDTDVFNTIQNRVGVLSVEDFSSEVNGREYSCRCTVYTEYSTEPIRLNFKI